MSAMRLLSACALAVLSEARKVSWYTSQGRKVSRRQLERLISLLAVVTAQMRSRS
jgi:hypothetical protein